MYDARALQQFLYLRSSARECTRAGASVGALRFAFYVFRINSLLAVILMQRSRRIRAPARSRGVEVAGDSGFEGGCSSTSDFSVFFRMFRSYLQ